MGVRPSFGSSTGQWVAHGRPMGADRRRWRPSHPNGTLRVPNRSGPNGDNICDHHGSNWKILSRSAADSVSSLAAAPINSFARPDLTNPPTRTQTALLNLSPRRRNGFVACPRRPCQRLRGDLAALRGLFRRVSGLRPPRGADAQRRICRTSASYRADLLRL